MRRDNPDNKIIRESTPYTTRTGVQVGLRYQRPRPVMSRDEELIQNALLGVSSGSHLRPWVVIALLVVAYALVSCMMGRL